MFMIKQRIILNSSQYFFTYSFLNIIWNTFINGTLHYHNNEAMSAENSFFQKIEHDYSLQQMMIPNPVKM